MQNPKDVLPIQSTLLLGQIGLVSYLSAQFPAFIYFTTIYVISLLIIGNQWRFKVFVNFPSLRKLNIVLPMGIAAIAYLSTHHSALTKQSLSIFLAAFFLGFCLLGYQIFRNWPYIKNPGLVFFTTNLDRRHAGMQLTLGLLGAISEELLFRGVLFSIFENHFLLYLFVSATFFCIYHFSTPWFQGNFRKEDIAIQLITTVIFCCSIYIFQSLWIALIGHFLFNLGANIRNIIILFNIGNSDDYDE